MDRAKLQQLLQEGLSLAEIGRREGLHESTVGYWVKKHGLKAAHLEKHAARGGLGREDLQALVEAGASIAEIAEAMDRSKATIRHWLREYGLKTHRAIREQSTDDTVMRDCPHHGLTLFKLRSSGGYRCLACRSEAVGKR
jgi:transposase-like protein